MKLSQHILDKNLMILASAGSGKTYQLGNRILGMIGVKEVDPERMVALTFTRKAAGEFADSILIKLAQGALDDEVALQLYDDVQGEFSVLEVLEKVVEVLPRFQLGTIDSFFSRIVRNFQYELGLSQGGFELIEGAQQELAMSELFQKVLGEMLSADEGDDFVQAFRRATMGKEELRVLWDLKKFVKHWHGFWKSGVTAEVFGNEVFFGDLPAPSRWEEEKGVRIQELREAFSSFDQWPRKGADEAVEKMLDTMERHTVGSGVLTEAKGLFQRAVESIQAGGPMVLKFYKEFEVGEEIGAMLEAAIRLVASCELASAVERTKGIAHLIARVDQQCEETLRSRGLLSFDDIKILLSRWKTDEEARLQRELIDYRLDGRYDHWFLDEFQDTSPAEWDGLSPLIVEAASEGGGSLFIVGDKKQAIYGWRGGDVRLFDEVQHFYQGGLTVAPMDQSFRSCPAVLELVNSVCGDLKMIETLFGKETATRWDWKDHDAARADVSGEARVEIAAKDEILDRLVARLREVGVGERELQCGVLVRTGKQVVEISEHLRSEGFSVIEEGRRKPMEDCAIGVVLSALIRWLADPADVFSRQIITMSPLELVLQHRFADERQSPWEELLAEASEEGFAMMVERLIAPLWKTLSPFDQRRVGDILQALEDFDATGAGTPRAARDILANFEIAQAPGEAAVQVMTIHKSKGLGFDVVMLPYVTDDQVPSRTNFDVAYDPGHWILQPPASWVRALFPDLIMVEERWVEEQRYEALCLLYVALTRAKRGLYLFLTKEPTSRKKEQQLEWSSPANLVRLTAGESSQERNEWWKDVPVQENKTEQIIPPLGEAVLVRERMIPSAHHGAGPFRAGGHGVQIGKEVHQLFQSLAWLSPGEKVKTPKNLAGMLVDHTLQNAEVRQIFEKRNGELFREQSLEVLLDGKWMSGVIDRMHVSPERIEIFDFKTDMTESSVELREKYREQMKAYEKAVGQIYPQEVVSYLISTHLKTLIKI